MSKLSEASSARSKRKRAAVETVDLCSDDESAPAVPSSEQSNKRPRTEERAPTPAPKLSQQNTRSDTPQAATEEEAAQTQLPTPENTPQKPKDVYEQPELADRYVPKTSVLEGVEFTNPHLFSLNPPFWENWRGSDYKALIEYLRANFNAVAFSRMIGRPVQEVQHVFAAIIANPLYDWEQATKRGEKGMKEIFELHSKGGVQKRAWGEPNNEGEQIYAELSGIAVGSVQLIDANTGTKVELLLPKLSRQDHDYLQYTLSADDMEQLWRGPMRKWGPNKDGKPVSGELHSIEAGVVKIRGVKSGRIFELGLEELSKVDKEFLRCELVEEDKVKLKLDSKKVDEEEQEQ